MLNLPRRPRRNRRTAAIRELTQETTLSVSNLIYPMFILEGTGLKSEIKSMPGIHRFSLDTLLEELKEVTDLGIRSICLFPNYPEDKKDKTATESYREGTLYL
ncbi:MAG: porphobilinogen synthase, partial [Bacteroidetes bacterium]|nr:porphobilinogen synthase [Bacteroidota bacterium]